MFIHEIYNGLEQFRKWAYHVVGLAFVHVSAIVLFVRRLSSWRFDDRRTMAFITTIFVDKTLKYRNALIGISATTRRYDPSQAATGES